MSDDETSSHSSQSSLSIEDENMPENVIRLYQFEPEFSSSDEGVEESVFLSTTQHSPWFVELHQDYETIFKLTYSF